MLLYDDSPLSERARHAWFRLLIVEERYSLMEAEMDRLRREEPWILRKRRPQPGSSVRYITLPQHALPEPRACK